MSPPARPTDPLTNWSGNYQYSTNQISHARSVDDVRAIVRRHDRLKVLGTRHCFNGIADSEHHLLSLSEMNRVVALDRSARTVTVEAGVKYGQLCPYLDENGFALHQLASLPHISIAGACATATHGSGVSNGSLATAVVAMEIVTADGEIVQLSREADARTFEGAVVNLGALGVVTKITLNIQPTFQMRQDVYLNLPTTQLENHYEKIAAAGYSVSLFTDWQADRINQVWIKRRLDDRSLDSSSNAEPASFGATLATRNVHPIGDISAENCTEQMGIPGPWYERLPHFRMGFTPSSGKELQSEYFVPRGNAVEAIRAVGSLRDHIRPHLLVSELRTIDADLLWMSPFYKRPSLAIHFTWKQDWESVRKVLPLIEAALAPIKPRPHWGKLFTMPPAQVQSCYEKLADFKQVANAFDPRGKFRNVFLAAYIGG